MLKRRSGVQVAAVFMLISVMMSLFLSALPVSADETTEEKTSPKVDYVISYTEEKIIVEPNCMYTLKAETDKGIKEKWYPVYGREINISKYIPKEGKTYTIAIRYVEDTLKDEKYVSRTEVKLASRPDIKAFKELVEYNNDKESFVNNSSSTIEIFIGDSAEALVLGKKGSKETDDNFIAYDTEKMPIDLFPAGASYTYRVAGIEETYKEDGKTVDVAGKFASLAGKGKVGAQPKAPKITLEYKAEKTKSGINTPACDYFKGTSEKVEVYIGDSEVIATDSTESYWEEVWVKIPAGKKNINMEDLKSLRSSEIKKINEDIAKGEGNGAKYRDFVDGIIINYKDNDPAKDVESYSIMFRTPKTSDGKKTASAKTTITVDCAKYKLVPTASFTDKKITAANTTTDTIKITLKNGTLANDLSSIGDIIKSGLVDDANKVTYELAANSETTGGRTGDNFFTILIKTTQPESTESDLVKEVESITLLASAILDTDGDVITNDVKVTGTITINIAKAKS